MSKSNMKSRKVWVAPELKKVGIEEITEGGRATGNDGNGTGSGNGAS